jgi:Fe2+ transport system protein FeoA
MFKRRFRFRKKHARWSRRGRHKKLRRRRFRPGYKATLADVPAGCKAKVLGFTKFLPPERLSHFQAFGLTPGYKVLVLQHSPVTVIQIEHTELALEPDLAKEIQITDIEDLD